MSSDAQQDRLVELAALAATEGLAADEARELGQLARVDATGQIDGLERAASAVHLALLPGGARPPAGLEERLLAGATRHFGGADGEHVRPLRALRTESPAPQQPQARPGRLLLLGGWLAAAGMLAMVLRLGSQLGVLENELGRGAPEERLELLLAEAPDARSVPWNESEHPLAEGASGDVVWSDAENQGFMRFRGLAPNEPTEAQYQLWIFRGSDPGAEPHPVDGGVFDVGTDGEVVVPIDAKLRVGHASLFVVTLEEPGGVVVSGREQIVMVGAASL